MAGHKRKQDSFPPITRSEFAEYLKRARSTKYVRQPELAMRDASLLAFEFLFKVRVSEAVGRTYPETSKERLKVTNADVYEGVTLKDFKVATVKDERVLRVGFRVLKRGRRKKVCNRCQEANNPTSQFCRFCGFSLKDAKFDCQLREVRVWDTVSITDPFVSYIIEWLKYLIKHKHKGPVWDISRQRAWQIMNELGIMNHTQRHWRATQLADVMDPFELKGELHRATIPFEYVHRSESRIRDKVKKADEIWK